MSGKGNAPDDDAENEEPPDDVDVDQPDKYAIPKKPTKVNPVPMTLHAQTLMASKSYQGALCMKKPLLST